MHLLLANRKYLFVFHNKYRKNEITLFHFSIMLTPVWRLCKYLSQYYLHK